MHLRQLFVMAFALHPLKCLWFLLLAQSLKRQAFGVAMLARCRKEAHGTLGLLLLYSVLFCYALLSKVIVSSGLVCFKYFVLFTIRSTVCLTEPCAFKRQSAFKRHISRQNDCMRHGKTNAETEQTWPRPHTSQHLVNVLHKPQTESCGMRHTSPAPIARDIKRQSVLRKEEGG